MSVASKTDLKPKPANKLTTDIFIQRAQQLHKDALGNPLYTYDKTEYISAHVKVCITCPKHGDFLQSPNKHITNQTICPKCSRENYCKKRRRSKEEFIRLVTKIHGNKYDYSKVIYVSSQKKLCIVCNKIDLFGKIHGDFWQTPNDHIYQKSGCPKCANRVNLTDDVIDKKLSIENRQIKRLEKCKGSHTKMKWQCTKDGCHFIWSTTPSNILSSGNGCPNCFSKRRIGETAVRFTGVKELYGSHFESIKTHALNRNLEFKITKEYIWNLFIKQEKKCALTGIELVLGCRGKNKTASLDRIDSSKGYIEGNVQWVHKDINKMKRNTPDNIFIRWCELVYKNSIKEKSNDNEV